MTNNKISSLQVGVILSFIILSTTSWIGLTDIIEIAGRDAYISVIVAFILGIISLIMILLINDKDNKFNIKKLILKIFGKYIGTFINMVIDIIMIIIGIVTLYGLSNFIISQFLSDTNIIYIYISISILVIYCVSKGIDVIARSSVILLFFSIILFLIGNISLIEEINLDYLKPVLEYGIKYPVLGGIILFLTNIVPIYIILIIPRNMISDKESYSKYIIFFYIFSMVSIFITTFITIASMGINLARMYEYPEYIILKRISLFGFLDRIENIICIQWIFRGFIMLCMIIYYVSNNVKKNSSMIFRIIVMGIIIFINLIYFKNNTMYGEFILNIYPFINLSLFMIFIIIGIRKRIVYNE